MILKSGATKQSRQEGERAGYSMPQHEKGITPNASRFDGLIK